MIQKNSLDLEKIDESSKMINSCKYDFDQLNFFFLENEKNVSKISEIEEDDNDYND